MEDNQQVLLMLGELKGAFAEVKEDVRELVISQKKIVSTVEGLPCNTHSSKILAIEEWKKACNGEKQAVQIEKVKGNISLKNGIIIGVITFLFGILTACITSFIAVGGIK